MYFTYNFCACKRFTSVVIILSSRKPEYLVRLLAGEVGIYPPLLTSSSGDSCILSDSLIIQEEETKEITIVKKVCLLYI